MYFVYSVTQSRYVTGRGRMCNCVTHGTTILGLIKNQKENRKEKFTNLFQNCVLPSTTRVQERNGKRYAGLELPDLFGTIWD